MASFTFGHCDINLSKISFPELQAALYLSFVISSPLVFSIAWVKTIILEEENSLREHSFFAHSRTSSRGENSRTRTIIFPQFLAGNS